jgi:hypothetical protein
VMTRTRLRLDGAGKRPCVAKRLQDCRCCLSRGGPARGALTKEARLDGRNAAPPPDPADR